MGIIVAVALSQFVVSQLRKGILLKASAYPLLMICDLAEEPLHLAFHLDAYVALALIAYEFLSVVENYSRIRPLPRILQLAAEKAQEYLSTSVPPPPAPAPPPPATLEKTVTRVEVEPRNPSHPVEIPAVVTTVTKEVRQEPSVAKEDLGPGQKP